MYRGNASPSAPVIASALSICHVSSRSPSARDLHPAVAQRPISPMMTTEPPPEWTVGLAPMAVRAITDRMLPPTPVIP